MPLRNKFIVVGCGRLGSSLANRASQRGDSVIVIDSFAGSLERLDDSFAGFSIVGDATDRSVLTEQYLRTAETLLITTGDDNVNLFLATLAAKVFEVPKVYVRFADPDFSILVSGLNVQAVYPAELSFRQLEKMMEEDEQE